MLGGPWKTNTWYLLFSLFTNFRWKKNTSMKVTARTWTSQGVESWWPSVRDVSLVWTAVRITRHRWNWWISGNRRLIGSLVRKVSIYRRYVSDYDMTTCILNGHTKGINVEKLSISAFILSDVLDIFFFLRRPLEHGLTPIHLFLRSPDF